MISQQLTNPERRTRQWFKEITRENWSNERYRVCIRLVQMFQRKPTILWRLDPYLSVTFLHKSGEAVYRQY